MPFEIEPSYNIAPSTFEPIVRLNEDGERELALLRWGLVPFWAKDSKPSYTTINARAETACTNATYREAMKKRRCLVPADGFFEWKKLEAKTKQPYAIALKDGAPFAFAGLWECWRSKDGAEILETFSIVTTDPNELMTGLQIHDRMPVILAPSDYARWLDPGDLQRPPTDMLRPFDADKMRAWPVSTDVGSVKNNRPELLEEAKEYFG